VGFPTLQTLTQIFKDNEKVEFLAVQTVFEGYNINTQDKLRKNQKNMTCRFRWRTRPAILKPMTFRI